MRKLPLKKYVSGSMGRSQLVPGLSDIDVILIQFQSPYIAFHTLTTIAGHLKRQKIIFPVLGTPQVLTLHEFVYACEHFVCFALDDCLKLKRDVEPHQEIQAFKPGPIYRKITWYMNDLQSVQQNEATDKNLHIAKSYTRRLKQCFRALGLDSRSPEEFWKGIPSQKMRCSETIRVFIDRSGTGVLSEIESFIKRSLDEMGSPLKIQVVGDGPFCEQAVVYLSTSEADQFSVNGAHELAEQLDRKLKQEAQFSSYCVRFCILPEAWADLSIKLDVDQMVHIGCVSELDIEIEDLETFMFINQMNLRFSVLEKNETDFIRYAIFTYYYYFLVRDVTAILNVDTLRRKLKMYHQSDLCMDQENYQIIQELNVATLRLLANHSKLASPERLAIA